MSRKQAIIFMVLLVVVMLALFPGLGYLLEHVFHVK